MPLEISLQDAEGRVHESVGDPQNVLRLLLPSDTIAFPCLSSIDLAGSTAFGQSQMARFLEEWVVVTILAESDYENHLAAEVVRFARLCEREPDLRLMFTAATVREGDSAS